MKNLQNKPGESIRRQIALASVDQRLEWCEKNWSQAGRDIAIMRDALGTMGERIADWEANHQQGLRVVCVFMKFENGSGLAVPSCEYPTPEEMKDGLEAWFRRYINERSLMELEEQYSVHVVELDRPPSMGMLGAIHAQINPPSAPSRARTSFDRDVDRNRDRGI